MRSRGPKTGETSFRTLLSRLDEEAAEPAARPIAEPRLQGGSPPMGFLSVDGGFQAPVKTLTVPIPLAPRPVPESELPLLRQGRVLIVLGLVASFGAGAGTLYLSSSGKSELASSEVEATPPTPKPAAPPRAAPPTQEPKLVMRPIQVPPPSPPGNEPTVVAPPALANAATLVPSHADATGLALPAKPAALAPPLPPPAPKQAQPVIPAPPPTPAPPPAKAAVPSALPTSPPAAPAGASPPPAAVTAPPAAMRAADEASARVALAPPVVTQPAMPPTAARPAPPPVAQPAPPPAVTPTPPPAAAQPAPPPASTPAPPPPTAQPATPPPVAQPATPPPAAQPAPPPPVAQPAPQPPPPVAQPAPPPPPPVAQPVQPPPPPPVEVRLSLPALIEVEAGDAFALALTIEPAEAASKPMQVLLHGLPAGFTPSAGAALTPGSWQVPPGEAKALRIAVPPAAKGDHAIEIELLDQAGKHLASRATRIAVSARRPAQPPEAPEVAALVERARPLLERGDLANARLLLERAADGGSARAAMIMAETYDPTVLKQRGVLGAVGNAELARKWYQRAQALGSPDVASRLGALSDRPGK